MPPSYRIVDYSIRPAKHAERRMLCDAARRLSKFASVESYQYVGMGSVWFSDFLLFHRQLGIEKMISIERVGQQDRFDFNRPFGGVEMRFGETATVLPTIDWSLRTIAWLDYDDPLNLSILADVRTISTKAVGGTLLAVTVQCESAPLIETSEEDEKRPLRTPEEFRSLFGAARTPTELESKDLGGWQLATTCRRTISSEIDDALNAVNASRPPAQHMEFRQIMAIEYSDGAKMTTIVGTFVDKGQRPIFSSCAFDELSFYRADAPALRIEIPKLTPKEMRLLETKLPILDPTTIEHAPMPRRDAIAFARLYRYLPAFGSFEP